MVALDIYALPSRLGRNKMVACTCDHYASAPRPTRLPTKRSRHFYTKEKKFEQSVDVFWPEAQCLVFLFTLSATVIPCGLQYEAISLLSIATQHATRLQLLQLLARPSWTSAS